MSAIDDLIQALEALKQKPDGTILYAAEVHDLVDGIFAAMEMAGDVTVATTPIEGGNKITITDPEGVSHEFDVMDGVDGAPGNNGHNPCLGVFADQTALETAHPTAEVGDYAYADVTDSTTQTTTSHIFRYSGSAWVDNGEGSPDNQNAFDGGAGPTVAGTKIDNTQLVNPAANALAKAGDVMPLAAKLEGVTREETKSSPTIVDGMYVYANGSNYPKGSVRTSNVSAIAIVDVQGYDKVRLLVRTVASAVTSGMGFYADTLNTTTFASAEDSLIGDTIAWKVSANGTEENIIEVPTGAKYLLVSLQSSGDLTTQNFYCYLQSGETITEMYVKDTTELANPKSGSLAMAEDVMQLSAMLRGVSLKEQKVMPNSVSEVGQYVKGDGTTGESDGFQYGTFSIPEGSNKVRFVGYVRAGIVGTAGYCFVDSNNTWKGGGSYENDTTAQSDVRKEYIIDVPNGATILKTNIKGSVITDFYCYFDRGDSVVDLIENTDFGTCEQKISILGAIPINDFNIYFESPYNWVESGIYERSCVIFPVDGIEKIRVETNSDHNSHIGFLDDFPTPTNGEPANLIDGITVLQANTVSEISIPSGAKYIYFNYKYGQSSYIPKSVEVLEKKNTEKIVPSWESDYDYDTYIEENIVDRFNTSMDYISRKFYKIDHEAEYCVNLYMAGAYQTSNYALVRTYDETMTMLGSYYVHTPGTQTLYVMEPISFNSNVAFVEIRYWNRKTSTSHGYVGNSALMRKLKNDKWIPTNNICYCVSKIPANIMPNDYSVENSTFNQGEDWSAWGFYLPYNYARSLFTNNKYPIVASFHGSSGWVSPSNLGYDSTSRYDSIQGMFRQNGCIVFDINGYGVSYGADDKSRHWGNPRAVVTAKKAYEVLVSRFNGRRGMAISGISMGGSIAKSYCMTYPEDVVCAALEAPSELGGTCRFAFNGNQEENVSQTSAAHAWGYADASAMYADVEHTAFVGYSPCISPHVIDSNGYIKKIVQTQWNSQSAIFADLDKFVCGFPVEVKIWQGDSDDSVPIEYNQWFVKTVRNAGGNATIRICPNCEHDLNEYPWVIQEVVDYVVGKMKI